MKEYRIGLNMYNMIKDEKESNGPWDNFMNYVRDDNVDVFVALHGKDYMKITYDPKAPDEVKEVPIQG